MALRLACFAAALLMAAAVVMAEEPESPSAGEAITKRIASVVTKDSGVLEQLHAAKETIMRRVEVAKAKAEGATGLVEDEAGGASAAAPPPHPLSLQYVHPGEAKPKPPAEPAAGASGAPPAKPPCDCDKDKKQQGASGASGGASGAPAPDEAGGGMSGSAGAPSQDDQMEGASGEIGQAAVKVDPAVTNNTATPPPGETWLGAHALYRLQHGSPELSWNAAAAEQAHGWLQELRGEYLAQQKNSSGAGSSAAKPSAPPQLHYPATVELKKKFMLSSASSKRLGQNLAMVSVTGAASVKDPAKFDQEQGPEYKSAVRKMVKMWAEERQKYDFSKPGFSEETAHFTQLVWAGTKSVGCSVCRIDAAGTDYIMGMCNYLPAGNLMTKDGNNFKANVKPAKQQQQDGKPATKPATPRFRAAVV